MFAWQPPHFYALAMRRTEEYRAANIPMLPVVKGFERTKKSMLGMGSTIFPLPFLLTELGIGFIVLATVLNIGWLYFAIKGFKAKDDIEMGNKMFIYSLNYMTILFVCYDYFFDIYLTDGILSFVTGIHIEGSTVHIEHKYIIRKRGLI